MKISNNFNTQDETKPLNQSKNNENDILSIRKSKLSIINDLNQSSNDNKSSKLNMPKNKGKEI